MYVCKKCHDRDEKIVGCFILFTQHPCKKSKCEVCGKSGVVADCWAYDYTNDPWADFIMAKQSTKKDEVTTISK